MTTIEAAADGAPKRCAERSRARSLTVAKKSAAPTAPTPRTYSKRSVTAVFCANRILFFDYGSLVSRNDPRYFFPSPIMIEATERGRNTDNSDFTAIGR